MLSFFLVVLSALFFLGIINRTKSICSGRKGPGIFQPLKDIWVLIRKGNVFSETTSFVFQIAPTISFVSILCAILLVPFDGKSVIHFNGDFVFFAYLLALGKFFTIIGALDTGSSFEGMGASREALYSMLIEPAFFIIMGTLALITGYTSFSEIFSNIHFNHPHSFLIGLLSFYLIIQIAMVENCRVPVDDPKTHLELTMIHEVMVLDNSGFDMALIHLGQALKFSMYGALMANSLVPAQWNIVAQIALFLGIQFCFAVVVGLQESFRARNRMTDNPKFLLTLSAIALLAFTVALILTNKM